MEICLKIFLTIVILFVISQMGFMKQPQYYDKFEQWRSKYKWVRESFLGAPIRFLMEDNTIKWLAWIIKFSFATLLWL